jgi:hypothetical protein
MGELISAMQHTLLGIGEHDVCIISWNDRANDRADDFDALKARKQSSYEWSDCKTAHCRLGGNSVGLGDTFREEPPLSRERFGIDKKEIEPVAALRAAKEEAVVAFPHFIEKYLADIRVGIAGDPGRAS